MNVDVSQALALSLGILIASGFAVYRCFRQNRIFSALGGLHLNIFFMYGFGTSCYVLQPLQTERLSHELVVQQIAKNGIPILIGYLVWLVVESQFLTKQNFDLRSAALRSQPSNLILFFAMALMGYLGAQDEISESGIGTIFAVLKNITYPCLVVAILKINRQNDGMQTGLNAAVILTLLLFSFYSPWRSELILSMTYMLLAFVYRYPNRLVPIGFATVAAMIFIFPFIQFKKANYEQFQSDPIGSFLDSQAISPNERLEMTTLFAAERLNSMREISYITNAIEQRIIGYKFGETIIESVTQLVPRALWPDKPSFNTIYNRLLSREIGLVGKEDQGTSWGVNFIAEFAYNFDVWFYVLYIPLVFTIFHGFDCLGKWLCKRPETSLFLPLTLFCIGFNGYSMSMLSTYILWTFFVYKSADILFSSLATQSHE